MSNLQTRQAPLELLVVAQLAAIKKQELVLKTRLTSMGHSEKMGAVRSEISALQITTDRLSRMIDAMSPLGGYSETRA